MVGFKIRQTELVMDIAQICGRKVADREDTTFTGERKVSDMFERILSWKSVMSILKLIVNCL